MGSENLSPYKARVFKLELLHREFYVDANGISRERSVGEDKFAFELSDGIYGVDAVVKVRHLSTGGKIPDVAAPLKGIGFSFYIAHQKDRVGGGPTLKIERNRRGVYPVIFDFTYADQGSGGNASASDSTEFKLIHKPKPADLPPRKQDEPRKPLKPRKPAGD